ncbi:MAG: ATP-binding protein [Clostridia bacterium]|nr:ATP-binding protein [Clostridia bacterium]
MYKRDIYEKAMATLKERRSAALTRAATFHETMREAEPRVREIEQKMAQSSAKVVAAILGKGNVDQQVEQIKNENLALQEELAALLKKHGAKVGNFEPVYTCPACQDTGFADGKPCACLEQLMREYSCLELSELSAMKPTSFDDLSLEYYSSRADGRTGIAPRVQMRQVIEYCRAYARNFDGRDDSLLLRGPTGVGKTHLSLAIAGEVLSQGYSVVYGPIQQLLHRMEREHFGRADGNTEDILLECDLLILDDVGTEFSSNFYTSALYNIINGRLMAEKPTIISTNLNQKELTDRYGEQIASRVTGLFEPLVCVGKDIRQQKLKQSLKGE